MKIQAVVAGYLFNHQQLSSCTFGMWLLLQLSVFCPLLSGVGIGLLGLTPFIIVHYVTGRNHTVQTVSFRGARAHDVQQFNWEWVLNGSTGVLGSRVCKVSQERRRGTTKSLPHNLLVLFVCSDQVTHLSYSLLIHLLISIYPIFVLF